MLLALLPGTQAASAVHGNHAVIDVTFRGDTAWLSSAQVAGGAGRRAVSCSIAGQETTLGQHNSPPMGPVTFDLTDAPHLRVRDCAGIGVVFSDTTSGNLMYTLPDKALLALSPEKPGLVTGVSSNAAGQILTVTLTSGDQALSRVVPVATDGTFSVDFSDEFDGTWEFGAVVQSVLRQDAGGSIIDLRATRRLPSASVVTSPDVPGALPPILGDEEQLADITLSGITPSKPFSGFGETATLTSAVRTYARLISGGGTVKHLGQSIAFAPPSHVITGCNLTAGSCSGTSTADATLAVTALSEKAFVSKRDVIVDANGDWTIDLAADGFPGSSVIQVAASLRHTDGGQYVAFDAVGDGPLGDGTPGPRVLVDVDGGHISIAPLPGPGANTWTVTATSGSTTHTATATPVKISAGLKGTDFTPALNVASGYSLNVDNGAGLGQSWQVSRLAWSVADAATGNVTGTVDNGAEVEVLGDFGVLGRPSRLVVANASGAFSALLDAPASPGTSVNVLVPIVRAGTTSPAGFVADVSSSLRDQLLGATGGMARGHGTSSTRVPALVRRLDAVSVTPTTTWRYDVVAHPGGAADLTARFDVRDPLAPFGWDSDATLSSRTDQVQIREGGVNVRRPSTAIDLYVPFTVDDGLLGGPVDTTDLHVGYHAETEAGWETVPTPSTTMCIDPTLEGLDPRCLTYPMPFVIADDIPHLGFAATDIALFQGNPAGALDIAREWGGEGTGRIETSLAVSQAAFEAADAVVITRADDFADALSASALAAAVDAPILLNPTDVLHEGVSGEIDRLGAKTVYLAGGPGAISIDVEDAINAKEGVTAVRLGGANRFATSELIARTAVAKWKADGIATAGKRVLIALGSHPDPTRAWPDALAAGQLAAHDHAPILLIDRDNVPDVIRDSALLAASACPCRVTAIGGTGTLPQSTVNQLAATGRTLDRVAGASRYATSMVAAKAAIAAGGIDRAVVFATGGNFPDGLAAAAAAAHLGGIVILVPSEDLANASDVLTWLLGKEGATRRAIIAGGPGAVSDLVLQQITEALDGTTNNPPPAA